MPRQKYRKEGKSLNIEQVRPQQQVLTLQVSNILYSHKYGGSEIHLLFLQLSFQIELYHQAYRGCKVLKPLLFKLWECLAFNTMQFPICFLVEERDISLFPISNNKKIWRAHQFTTESSYKIVPLYFWHNFQRIRKTSFRLDWTLKWRNFMFLSKRTTIFNLCWHCWCSLVAQEFFSGVYNPKWMEHIDDNRL